MPLWIFAVLIPILAIAAFSAFAFWRMLSPTRVAVPDPQLFVENFSDKYRPLERLLDEDDLDYLRDQPGASKRMIRAFRAKRVESFRGYLRCLSRDFELIHGAARLLLLRQEKDRPDLVRNLIRQKLNFRLTLLRTEMRLVAYEHGFGAVDVAPLVEMLSGMQSTVHFIVNQPIGARSRA